MNGIAVFFPGIGYHCDKPLLYFSRELAREAGYQEIVNVNYSYHVEDIRGNPEKMRAAGLALFAQTEDALKEIRWDAYDDILFVSKSVGTAIAAAYRLPERVLYARRADIRRTSAQRHCLHGNRRPVGGNGNRIVRL